MEFNLIIKKLNNTLSESETIIFNKWYNESEVHRVYFDKVKNGYKNDAIPVDIESGWKTIEKRIKPAPASKSIYFKYAFAASIVLMVSLTFIFQNNSVVNSDPPVIVNNNVEIGSDKVTLTLEDGTIVFIEKGQQYTLNNLESDGENLIYKESTDKAATLSYNYLTIPRGEQFFIKLSDGTKIWLNSESQLKYPVQFISGETRTVELVYGEAYFDVSPSRHHNGAKFKVVNTSQDVEVIGTQFNIKAYNDDTSVYTTLVEGKVIVNIDGEWQELNLNDQLNLNKDDQTFSIKKVDVRDEISWKDGIFSFERTPLKDIMKVLSRSYDVEVVFENKSLEDVKFFGAIGKDQPIEEILESIKQFNIIESYEIKTNVIKLK
ncbi:FecR family protein [Gelidibacter japonicus]|uniref:FecR family protein n=1 Tax=Gelidibacter japonicus TaxID=1962232 RepID=UPI003A93D854